MTKDTIFQMESAHQSSSRINKFKSIPRHITVKLQQNTEYKILKATKEKRTPKEHNVDSQNTQQQQK